MEFLKLVNTLTKDKKLTRCDACVMAVITTLAQYEPNYIRELSYSDIQAEFETIPIRTIQRCVKHLEELKYIEVIRNGTKKNKYKVLIPIPQKERKNKHNKNISIPDLDVEPYKGFINNFTLASDNKGGDNI